MGLTSMRVNLGCGEAYLDGWVNVDSSPDVRADVHMDVIEFVRRHGPEIYEIYMGHLLEHMMPTEALSLLIVINERTRAGCGVSAVTPDMAAIFNAYLSGEMDNAQLNEDFVYSYIQPSRHVWCHDSKSLRDLFEQAGFSDIEAIDPLTWEPALSKTEREDRWQCGLRGRSTAKQVGLIVDHSVPWNDRSARPEADREIAGLPPIEQLLAEVRRLREDAVRQASIRIDLDREIRALRGVEEPEPAEDDLDVDPSSPSGRATRRIPTRRPRVAPSGAENEGAGRMRDRLAPEGSARRSHIRAARILAKHVETILKDGVRDADVAVREYRRVAGYVPTRRVGYRRWVRDSEPTTISLKAQRRVSSKATHPTRFLVIIQAVADGDLSETLGSLDSQTWEHWAAVVVGSEDTRRVGDTRIRYAAPTDAGNPEATNAVVAESDDDFVLLLRAGDRLAPGGLFALHVAGWSDPFVDLITFDDDVIGFDGKRTDPVFRPSWSPEMLLGRNYIGSAFAIRRERFKFAGGLRRERADGGHWDLLLRGRLDESRVTRTSQVLLHLGGEREQVSAGAATEILTEHVRSLGLPVNVTGSAGCSRLVWDLPDWPSVSIVIPTRHNRTMLERLLPSLARTDYPGKVDITIIDNGEQNSENSKWYERFSDDLNLGVVSWSEPFNYSRVNNHGASLSTGEILVFLNDDMEALDPGWLREIVGWAARPEVGVAGLQLLDGDGKVQHAGAILGLGGFADHLFQGMNPDSETIFGPVCSYRNLLAVTGACLGVRRERFEAWGGFDENFQLCGSDVALGLSAVIDGYRVVCSPFASLRHYESVTRGTNVPPGDFFASYWRYSPWLFGGDPYFSPSLSLGDRVPSLRGPKDPSPGERISVPLGRTFKVFRQRGSEEDSIGLARLSHFLPSDRAAVEQLHETNRASFPVRTVNWFIPELDSPFYGGINTAFRIADHLATHHGVENRFVVWGAGPSDFVGSGIAAAFPSLRGAPLTFVRDFSYAELRNVPEADVGISTLWVTAYGLALSEGMRRKYYLIQDFEPMFYPAGTQYALAEETYRLGLYGLCNTENLARIYRSDYHGKAISFTPAVDTSVFHAEGRTYRGPQDPVTVFVYARPGHWRNCWELASLALEGLKERLGSKVRILTAGSWAIPESDLHGHVGTGGIRHLGLLDYRSTGQLYRQCDVGLALTVSKHPSYLPLELMACGVPVVAFDNPWGHWILRDGQNSLLADRTVDHLTDCLERLCVDRGLRERLQQQALKDIAEGHSRWDVALSGIYDALCDPERAMGQEDVRLVEHEVGPDLVRPEGAK